MKHKLAAFFLSLGFTISSSAHAELRLMFSDNDLLLDEKDVAALVCDDAAADETLKLEFVEELRSVLSPEPAGGAILVVAGAEGRYQKPVSWPDTRAACLLGLTEEPGENEVKWSCGELRSRVCIPDVDRGGATAEDSPSISYHAIGRAIVMDSETASVVRIVTGDPALEHYALKLKGDIKDQFAEGTNHYLNHFVFVTMGPEVLVGARILGAMDSASHIPLYGVSDQLATEIEASLRSH